jgi:hypothetical protein
MGESCQVADPSSILAAALELLADEPLWIETGQTISSWISARKRSCNSYFL